MTSRERVVLALSRKEPDRVPFDLGGTHNSSIHIDAYKKLREYMGLKKSEPEIFDIIQQCVHPEEDVLRELNIDTRTINLMPPKNWKLEVKEEETYHFFIDEWGVTWKKPKYGYYFDMIAHPLVNATIKDLDTYSWPDPNDPGRFEGLRDKAKELFENTEYAIIGDPRMGSMFELNWYMPGLERFLVDMIENVEFIDKLISISFEIQIKIISKFLDAVGDYIQVLALNGDLAMQTGPFMSHELYSRIIKPYHKKLYKIVKSKTDVKMFRHCCGDIVPFLPDFIEYGIDAMHPVQVSAREMDSKKLKEKFGDRMGFWGGIDTMHVLPYGTVKDVEQEVKKRIFDLAPGGGYVLAAVHNIQRDVPPENIVAMFRAGEKYGKYPIKNYN